MSDFRPKIEMMKVRDLRPSPSNARTHSDAQVRQIADSIKRFGFTNPALIGDGNEIIAGHGRIEGAKVAGIDEVPVVRLSHLTATERRAYMLADNKLALNAGWDEEILASELHALISLDFDVPVLGFSAPEIDAILDEAAERDVEAGDEEEDRIPPLPAEPVTLSGDVWQLGRHRLICGDARDPKAYSGLLGDEAVDLLFTDPPYNVQIEGHVCGSGRIHHREFAMGAGEMSRDQFTHFLVDTLGPAARACRDGAIAFVCMDWRHMGELLAAGEKVFSELKNVCVWNKKNAGMGTFYRSKHEMIFAFKVGTAPHTNNFGLGDTGRYRTNVWDYHGISSLGAGRQGELAMHPTVKPVALVADAIRDCSKRGEVVLDIFGGSGTTLIAARKCGRIARLIEYDPAYCDTTIRRYELLAGSPARLKSNGAIFESVAADRQGPHATPSQ
jgi:DNA modification methylase